MPELPEVETVRRGLQHLITGFRIADAIDLHPRALKPESIAPLHTLNGAKITGTNRRGKFMWITLNRPYVLTAHLGMSGQFLIHQKDRPKATHIRAQFQLKKPMRLRSLKFIQTTKALPTMFCSGTKPQKRESRELSRLSPIR
mgnify:CR=1 FL=1